MKIAFVTDSTFYMEPDFIKKHNIHQVPLSVNFENVSYIENVENKNELKEIYDRIRKFKKLPTTSQPAITSFVDKYQQLVDEGYTRILVFTISSTLSGTFQGANLAIEMVENIGNTSIEVFDTRNVAHAATILLGEIVRYQKEVDPKLPHEDIKKMVDFYQKASKTYLVVDSLDYLSYGGRISPAIAAAGNLFGIKPLLKIEEGEFIEVAKCRSRKIAYKKIIELFEEDHSNGKKMYITGAHARKEKELISLKSHIDKLKNEDDYDLGTSELGPVISVHVGPGTIDRKSVV